MQIVKKKSNGSLKVNASAEHQQSIKIIKGETVLAASPFLI